MSVVRWWTGALLPSERFVVIVEKQFSRGSRVAQRIARKQRAHGDDVIVRCFKGYRKQWDRAFRNGARDNFPRGDVVHVIDDVGPLPLEFLARLDRWLRAGDRVVVRVTQLGYLSRDSMCRADSIVVMGYVSLHDQARARPRYRLPWGPRGGGAARPSPCGPPL